MLNLTHVTICGLNRRDALGIARLAIDTLRGTVAGKPTHCHTLGERIQARKALREDVSVSGPPEGSHFQEGFDYLLDEEGIAFRLADDQGL